MSLNVSDVLHSEPVRTVFYPVLVIVVGYAVTKSYLDGQTAALVLSTVGGLVGVGATELARSKVSPVKPTAEEAYDDGFEGGAHEYRDLGR